MVKKIYKFKATISNSDLDTVETKYFFNTKSLTDELGVPRSSIFMMLNPNKPSIEKYRHIKLERCTEPAYVIVERQF